MQEERSLRGLLLDAHILRGLLGAALPPLRSLLALVPPARRPLRPRQVVYVLAVSISLWLWPPITHSSLWCRQGVHGAQVVLRRRQDARRQRGAPALQGDAADTQAEEGNALPGLLLKKLPNCVTIKIII